MNSITACGCLPLVEVHPAPLVLTMRATVSPELIETESLSKHELRATPVTPQVIVPLVAPFILNAPVVVQVALPEVTTKPRFCMVPAGKGTTLLGAAKLLLACQGKMSLDPLVPIAGAGLVLITSYSSSTKSSCDPSVE